MADDAATAGHLTAVAQAIMAVSVKLPTFWVKDPAHWFLQVESSFGRAHNHRQPHKV